MLSSRRFVQTVLMAERRNDYRLSIKGLARFLAEEADLTEFKAGEVSAEDVAAELIEGRWLNDLSDAIVDHLNKEKK